MSEFYSVEQVANRLGLHVRTVRGYVREGRLKAVRIGKQYRIAPADREGNSIFTRLGNALRAKTFIESSFFEEGAGSTVRRNMAIDLSTLPADRYHLELEVTDLVGGGSARRELTFRRAE